MSLPAFLSLPTADEIFWIETADGMRLPVYRLAGPAGGPAVLFGHANGMAAGSYEPWLRLLARDATVFAFDSRGHGAAHGPTEPVARLFGVDRVANDLLAISEAVLARLAGTPLVCVGHSLNAAAALSLAAQRRDPRWHDLVLFEPPIFPPPDAPSYGAAIDLQGRIIAAADRRRADWPSPDGLYARLEGNGPFARFDKAMLRAHCHATLRPKSDGGYTLCCLPSVESHIYRATRDADTWHHLPAIPRSVHLVSGDPTLPDHDWVTGAIVEIAERLPNVTLDAVPETGHMMICERPEACRALVARWFP